MAVFCTAMCFSFIDGDSSEIERCDVADLPCEIIYCSFAAPYAPVCDDKNVTFDNLCAAQCGFRANVVCTGECPCPEDCSPSAFLSVAR